MIANQNLQPFDKLIADTTDKKILIKRVTAAAKRLKLDSCKGHGEYIKFERLWQIKAKGIAESRVVGPITLCRVVGAFRRYINDLPVLGGASAFIKLAGDNVIDSVGIDWRPCIENPIEETKVIDPEEAADRIIKELAVGTLKTNFISENYVPEMFSLGYFSLPKRRNQAFMQPVYVAMFRACGWTTLNRLIVIPASPSAYEPICRIAQAPPAEIAKPKPPSSSP